MYTPLIKHTGTHSSTQTCQIFKIKGLHVTDYYCVHKDMVESGLSRSVDGLLTHFNLAHEQIRLRSGDGFGLFTIKFRHVNSESAMARAQLAFKGNGR